LPQIGNNQPRPKPWSHSWKMFAVWPACNRDRDLADEPHWCSSLFACRNACGVADKIDIVEVDDIFGYNLPLTTREKAVHLICSHLDCVQCKEHVC
jgi:hypothetical protein